VAGRIVKSKTVIKKINRPFLLVSSVIAILSLSVMSYYLFRSGAHRKSTAVEKTAFRIIEPGELPQNQDLRDSLAIVYGFRFSYPGCEVTDALLLEAEVHNAEVIRRLETAHGKNWLKRFQHELDSLSR